MQLDKQKFLALLEELNSHTLYYPDAMARHLRSCGLSVEVSEDKAAIFVEGLAIAVTDPEWGEPGISPSSVLSAMFELTVGESPRSEMNGRGFWYRDVTAQLRKKWGILEL